jgi:hypothetical protein
MFELRQLMTGRAKQPKIRPHTLSSAIYSLTATTTKAHLRRRTGGCCVGQPATRGMASRGLTRSWGSGSPVRQALKALM